MQGPSRLALLEAATRALFDTPVAVAVTAKQGGHPAPFAEEAVHVARAVPARRVEFAAGRAAIRAAMATLGMPAEAVRNGPDRAPVWPSGCIGSLSHSHTLCVAVLARAGDARSVGIDIEEDTPLDSALFDTICTPGERDLIAGSNAGGLAKLVFCAKEAAYKAQYPLTATLFDFQTLEIALDPALTGFTATFRKPIGPFALGDSLPGKVAWIAGHLVTGVTIGHLTREGA